MAIDLSTKCRLMALNDRVWTKMIGQQLPLLHGWSLLITLLMTLTGFGLIEVAAAAETNTSQLLCSSVRYAYRAKGFSDKEVPHEPVSGTKLRFCPQGLTCCTELMENKLSNASRQEYELALRDNTRKLLMTFDSRSKKFDEFFRELLENSKRDFHEMFKKTYGILYEQNSEVFTDLFRDLEDYYSKGKLDLEEAMDRFFTALYQRMFTVLNAQFRFDDKYLICVNTHMKELKPFGDVPKKLSVQVKRSFIATRTFTQALNVGRDVITKIQSLSPSSECSQALMRMSLCPVCRGLPDLKPCSNFCLNVLKGCLAYHSELATEWDNYIDALVKVSARLLGPFNIELVVDPIDIKISDAIMNFQENGYEISQKVFKGCGQPRLGKRNAPEINFQSIKFDRNGGNVRPTTAAGTSLERLVKDIQHKVKMSKGFWSKLPHQVCTHEKMAAQSTIDGDCWNGSERTRYATALMDDGMANQAVNSEAADVTRPNSLVNEQIFSLRLITNKLEHAYNGMDVEWDDEWGQGSGSGSGSGDGDRTEEEDDDEDRIRHDPNPHIFRDSNPRIFQDSNPRIFQDSNPHIFRDSNQGTENTGRTNNDNDIEFSPGSTPTQNENDISTSSSAPPLDNPAALTPTRALLSYLVPIIVMWIGNMF